MSFIELEDSWTLVIDVTIIQCRFDHAFTMVLADGPGGIFEIRVEQQFGLSNLPGVVLNPEDEPVLMAPALGLLGQAVKRIVAYKDGRLEVQFASGVLLHVTPNEEYESWSITGANHVMIISIPGGELALWNQHR